MESEWRMNVVREGVVGKRDFIPPNGFTTIEFVAYDLVYGVPMVDIRRLSGGIWYGYAVRLRDGVVELFNDPRLVLTDAPHFPYGRAVSPDSLP